MSISLESIRRGKQIKAPKVTIYGVGGIGKTTWASEAPKPIFMFTEEGQGKIDLDCFELRPKDPVLKSWEEIMGCLEFLHTGDHDFQTAVLDSIDFAEPLLHRYTCERHGEPAIETNKGEFGFQRGYIHAVNEAREMTRWFDALRNDRGMAIIIIGHADTKKFSAPDAESYDRWKLGVHEKLANHLHDWSDAFLFCNYRATVVKDKEGHKKERKRGVGTGQRVIYTEERPAWRAKNRYDLPAEMEMPKGQSWQVFQDAFAASVTD